MNNTVVEPAALHSVIIKQCLECDPPFVITQSLFKLPVKRAETVNYSLIFLALQSLSFFFATAPHFGHSYLPGTFSFFGLSFLQPMGLTSHL